MFEDLKWEIKSYEDDNQNIQWLGRNADIMMCYNLEITKNHMSCSLRWAVAKEKTMEFSTGYYCSQQKIPSSFPNKAKPENYRTWSLKLAR